MATEAVADTTRRVRGAPEGPELVATAGVFFTREGCNAGLRPLGSLEASGAGCPDVVLLRLRACAGGSTTGDPARLIEVRIGKGGLVGRSDVPEAVLLTTVGVSSSSAGSVVAESGARTSRFRGDNCESVR